MVDLLRSLDTPVLGEEKGLIRKNRIRVIVINEDQTGKTYFRKYPDSNYFVIKGKLYFFVSKAVINLDWPTILYFYNNPWPIFCKYSISELDGLSIRTPEQIAALSQEEKVILAGFAQDSKAGQLAFNSAWMAGLLERKGFKTWHLLLIFGGLLIAVLIVLQLTCKINIMNLKQCAKLFYFLPFLKKSKKED